MRALPLVSPWLLVSGGPSDGESLSQETAARKCFVVDQ